MSLLSQIVSAFAPGARAPDAPTYRSLLHESAAYSGRLDGYAPYAADHEPPDLTATAERAGLVAGRIVAVAAERAAEAEAWLRRAGLAVSPDPDSWDAVGRHLAERVEGSREPGSDRYSPALPRRGPGPAPTQIGGESTTQLRPLWRSLALDLGLLLGRDMIAARPGAGWMAENALRARDSSVSGEPVVATADGLVLGAPVLEVRRFLHAALLARLGLREAAPPLGDALRRLAAAEDPENRPDPAADLVSALRAFVSEHGTLPPERDLPAIAAEYGLDALPLLPPDLDALRRPAP